MDNQMIYDLLYTTRQAAEMMASTMWGDAAGGNSQLLRVNMANIRRKLEQNPAEPQYILTEIGVGYRMRDVL